MAYCPHDSATLMQPVIQKILNPAPQSILESSVYQTLSPSGKPFFQSILESMMILKRDLNFIRLITLSCTILSSGFHRIERGNLVRLPPDFYKPCAVSLLIHSNQQKFFYQCEAYAAVVMVLIIFVIPL